MTIVVVFALMKGIDSFLLAGFMGIIGTIFGFSISKLKKK